MLLFLPGSLEWIRAAQAAPVAVPEPIVVEGQTMGTTYRLVYFDEPQERNFKREVDSLLLRLNKAISTYDPASDISKFNRSKRGIRPEFGYLPDILKSARDIYEASGGAFDPTVMPLVNAWGFGPQKHSVGAEAVVDSLRQLVGLDKVRFSNRRVCKKNPGTQLDMGGIGQGYGADVIFAFLKSRGIRHMLVELGGEGLAWGKNLKKDSPWTIGILDPNSTPDHQFFKAYVTLEDQAFTTSGNYFNYRVVDGRKYGHTIDPVSGYPVQHSLLSASVFAADGATADGWATAFMVMGVEKAIEKIATLPNIDAIFIYSAGTGELKTFVTPGIKDQVQLE
jgi:FAD:protein FMN transferase